ncbi:MAG: lipocalin-like domain-containing protein [Verrucomicrobiota bacterium]
MRIPPFPVLPLRVRRGFFGMLWGVLGLLTVYVSGAGPDGFETPRSGRTFTFPQDHGSHPGFSIEWWYVTGHLWETNGTRHGFQATFFRRSAPRNALGETAATTAFGDSQIHLAHMALLDGSSGRFLHQERLNREGWDAHASASGLDIRNGNWTMRWNGEDVSVRNPIELRGSVRTDASFSLSLVPRKPLVVFGTNGVSRKAAEPWAASHYLTFPRLEVSGTLELAGKPRTVHGEAWMDHEFSSSQLGAGQVGWDWAGIQLNDGREIMAYRMRREDGSLDPFSTLAWVDAQGGVRHLGPDQFQWTPDGRWRSPATDAVYPARIRLTAFDPQSGTPRTLTLEPVAAAQELTGGLGGIAYWEGACRVLDASGRDVGRAFLEMTGYAGSLSGRF